MSRVSLLDQEQNVRSLNIVDSQAPIYRLFNGESSQASLILTLNLSNNHVRISDSLVFGSWINISNNCLVTSASMRGSLPGFYLAEQHRPIFSNVLSPAGRTL